MRTLQEFITAALQNVKREDMQQRLPRILEHWNLTEARQIIADSNRIPRGPIGMKEKGAIGEAVVAAAVRHYFGQYDGIGHFDFQYPYWGNRGPDATWSERTMDIILYLPAGPGKSTAFQIEAKNRQGVDASALNGPSLGKQIEKDLRYLNPVIAPERPLIPVWWFLQGLDKAARNQLEAMKFRVVDFNADLDAEVHIAFATNLSASAS